MWMCLVSDTEHFLHCNFQLVGCLVQHITAGTFYYFQWFCLADWLSFSLFLCRFDCANCPSMWPRGNGRLLIKLIENFWWKSQHGLSIQSLLEYGVRGCTRCWIHCLEWDLKLKICDVYVLELQYLLESHLYRIEKMNMLAKKTYQAVSIWERLQ